MISYEQNTNDIDADEEDEKASVHVRYRYAILPLLWFLGLTGQSDRIAPPSFMFDLNALLTVIWAWQLDWPTTTTLQD